MSRAWDNLPTVSQMLFSINIQKLWPELFKLKRYKFSLKLWYHPDFMIEWQAKKSDCRDAQCTELTIGSKVIWQISNVGEHSTSFWSSCGQCQPLLLSVHLIWSLKILTAFWSVSMNGKICLCFKKTLSLSYADKPKTLRALKVVAKAT